MPAARTAARLRREHRLAILPPLPVAPPQHLTSEVDVLDPQPEAFLQPKAAAIHQSRDQPESPSQPAEYFLDFLSREDKRQSNGALGPWRERKSRKYSAGCE